MTSDSGPDFTQHSQELEKGILVPSGYIISSSKWKGSEISKTIKESLKVQFEDTIGVVDFHPTNSIAVVYLTEADLVAGSTYKRKLVKLRKIETMRGVVLAEKTISTQQYYPALQKFTMLDIGLDLIPITNQPEAGQLLCRMAHIHHRQQSNPFTIRTKTPSKKSLTLNTLQRVPKVGETKAKILLENFGNIKNIAFASKEELSLLVGANVANSIKTFFNKPP